MLTWQSIRSLFDAYLSQVLLALGTISPIAYLVRIGFNFEGAKYFYVGWSLIVLSFILFKLFCPSIVMIHRNGDEYYTNVSKKFNRNIMDIIYEFEFLYRKENENILSRIPCCIDDMFKRSHDENIKIFGDRKYLYYSTHTKFEFCNLSLSYLRLTISIMLYLSIALIQIPAITAFWDILIRT